MRNSLPSRRGFTVAEMAVSLGVLGLLGVVLFRVLQAGLVLYTKSVAVNLAHEETRKGILRLTRDIHASISIPEMRLLDSSSSIVVLPTPSPSPTPVVQNGGLPILSPHYAAVSFQNISSGPNYIWNDPGGTNNSLIMIKDGGGGILPVPGQQLIIPFWGPLYESDIIKVTGSKSTAGHSNVFLSNGYETGIKPRGVGGAQAITYYTDRVAYAVVNGSFYKDPQNGQYTPDAKKSTNYVWAPPSTVNGQLYSYTAGELHMYKQRYNGTAQVWQDFATVARNVTSPMPFYVPVNRGGSFDNKYVGIRLTTRDPHSSNRGYKATESVVDTTVDYRSAIALSQ